MGIKNFIHTLYELLPYKVVISYRKKRYYRFKDEIEKTLSKIPPNSNNVDATTSIIWVYWHQGFENAPELVKKCVESIIKNSNGYRVELLDYSSISNYVTLDSEIINLLEKNKISIAHFSDVLRLELLDKFGGIWIDSTVYLSSSIPQEIINSDLFLFKGSWKDGLQLENTSCVSNWFIAAKKNNPVIHATSICMIEYLKKYKRIYNYYMCHYIMTILFRHLKNFWDAMPIYPNVLPHILQFSEINKKFSENEMQRALSNCFCHKLSYSLPIEKDSVLEHIISGE